MRAVIFILFASSLAVTADGFIFDTINDIINIGVGIINGIAQGFVSLVGAFFNIFKNIVGVGLNIGGHIIGVVVDPFGLWKDNKNDHGHADGTVAKCLAIADIIFVLDSSGSMSRNEFKQEINFAKRVVEHFRVNDKEVRFGAISFSDTVQRVFGLGDSTSENVVKQYLDASPYQGGGTNTAGALSYILSNSLFSRNNGGRDGSSKIVIIITDGQSNSPSATSTAAYNLRAQGIRVIAVGVGTLWGINNELYNIGSGSNNVYTADFFTNLNSIEQKVSLRTCQIPIEDGNVPQTDKGCEKGFEKNPDKKGTCRDINECARGTSECQQTCVNLPGSYRCTCKAGFVIDTKNPANCRRAATCAAPVDIVAVIDASGSIGPENFKSLLTFLAKVTLQFTFGSKGSQWGALLFGSEVRSLFNLNTYSVRADVSKALTSAPYLASPTTFTHQGLDYVLNNKLFSPGKGGRSDAPDVVIVVTDGQSSIPEKTLASAKNLKASGARVVAVGITNQVSVSELASIASDEKSVTLISDWDLLDYAEENLAKVVCPEKIYD